MKMNSLASTLRFQSKVRISKSSFSMTRRWFSGEAKETVGFIGLGNMGNHMANNLAKAGFPLVLFDVSESSLSKFKGKNNVTIAKDPKQVASLSKQIVTMLPANQHVQQVYTGDDGLFAATQPGSLFLDASTIDPGLAREVATKAKAHKSHFMDAPVSGGVLGAEAGTLTFMVGGDQEPFPRAKQLLSYMGKNIVHCGGSGNGQVVKLCNNLVLAISMIGVSEAMNLGTKLGMDAKLLASIFNTSTARCWSSDSYNPVPGVMENVPASRGYTGGFGVDLMAKDLGLAIGAAAKEKIPLPLGGQALQLYNLLSSQGFGGKDFSSVFEFLSTKKK